MYIRRCLIFGMMSFEKNTCLIFRHMLFKTMSNQIRSFTATAGNSTQYTDCNSSQAQTTNHFASKQHILRKSCIPVSALFHFPPQVPLENNYLWNKWQTLISRHRLEGSKICGSTSPVSHFTACSEKLWPVLLYSGVAFPGKLWIFLPPHHGTS